MADEANDVASRVILTIAKTQHLDPSTFTADSTFEEMKIDSLDGINIVFAVEGEFGVDVPDEAMKALRSVRDVIDGVERLLAEKAAASTAEAS